MSWAYILVFNDKFGTREEIQGFIDTVPEITYWYACLPHSIFMTSTLTAGGIYERIKAHFGLDSGKRIFISEVHQDRHGWLPKQAWHMFSNPDSPRLKK